MNIYEHICTQWIALRQEREGLVLKAHRWLYHSTLGSRVIKKKERGGTCFEARPKRRPAWLSYVSSTYTHISGDLYVHIYVRILQLIYDYVRVLHSYTCVYYTHIRLHVYTITHVRGTCFEARPRRRPACLSSSCQGYYEP